MTTGKLPCAILLNNLTTPSVFGFLVTKLTSTLKATAFSYATHPWKPTICSTRILIHVTISSELVPNCGCDRMAQSQLAPGSSIDYDISSQAPSVVNECDLEAPWL